MLFSTSAKLPICGINKQVNPYRSEGGSLILMTTKLEYEVVPISEVPKEDLVVLYRKNQPTVLVVDDERVIADPSLHSGR
jgi:hypothetical protein